MGMGGLYYSCRPFSFLISPPTPTPTPPLVQLSPALFLPPHFRIMPPSPFPPLSFLVPPQEPFWAKRRERRDGDGGKKDDALRFPPLSPTRKYKKGTFFRTL